MKILHDFIDVACTGVTLSHKAYCIKKSFPHKSIVHIWHNYTCSNFPKYEQQQVALCYYQFTVIYNKQFLLFIWFRCRWLLCFWVDYFENYKSWELWSFLYSTAWNAMNGKQDINYIVDLTKLILIPKLILPEIPGVKVKYINYILVSMFSSLWLY